MVDKNLVDYFKKNLEKGYDIPFIEQILIENGYVYDASILPTYIGPVARLYYFWTSNLAEKEKNQLKNLFGGFKNGLRPVKPYRWNLESGR